MSAHSLRGSIRRLAAMSCAVVWGTVVMGATGLAIWFKIEVTHSLPRWVVDVAITIHYYEAILACLAIIVWHFYHVMFDPDVYPMLFTSNLLQVDPPLAGLRELRLRPSGFSRPAAQGGPAPHRLRSS